MWLWKAQILLTSFWNQYTYWSVYVIIFCDSTLLSVHWINILGIAALFYVVYFLFLISMSLSFPSLYLTRNRLKIVQPKHFLINTNWIKHKLCRKKRTFFLLFKLNSRHLLTCNCCFPGAFSKYYSPSSHLYDAHKRQVRFVFPKGIWSTFYVSIIQISAGPVYFLSYLFVFLTGALHTKHLWIFYCFSFSSTFPV